MRKFYALLAIILLSGILGVFELRNSNKSSRDKALQDFTKESSPAATKDVLSDIIKNGKPVKCTFSQELPSAVISGTTYINGGDSRTDLSAPDNSGVVKLSHTLIKDNIMYLWYDKSNAGMKIDTTKTLQRPGEVDQSSVATNPLLASNFSNVNALASAFNSNSYDCVPWEIDNFIFAVPPNIEFLDFDKVMTQVSANLCKKCDQEDSEASRLLCKKTLKCN